MRWLVLFIVRAWALIYPTNTDLSSLAEHTLTIFEAAEQAIISLYQLEARFPAESKQINPQTLRWLNQEISHSPILRIRGDKHAIGEIEFKGGEQRHLKGTLQHYQLVFWALLNPLRYPLDQVTDVRWLQTRFKHRWLVNGNDLPSLRDGPHGREYFGVQIAFDFTYLRGQPLEINTALSLLVKRRDGSVGPGKRVNKPTVEVEFVHEDDSDGDEGVGVNLGMAAMEKPPTSKQ